MILPLRTSLQKQSDRGRENFRVRPFVRNEIIKIQTERSWPVCSHGPPDGVVCVNPLTFPAVDIFPAEMMDWSQPRVSAAKEKKRICTIWHTAERAGTLTCSCYQAGRVGTGPVRSGLTFTRDAAEERGRKTLLEENVFLSQSGENQWSLFKTRMKQETRSGSHED